MVADGASDLLHLFDGEMLFSRIIREVPSLPLGGPAEVEVIVEAYH
jgi:hypothetical protein